MCLPPAHARVHSRPGPPAPTLCVQSTHEATSSFAVAGPTRWDFLRPLELSLEGASLCSWACPSLLRSENFRSISSSLAVVQRRRHAIPTVGHLRRCVRTWPLWCRCRLQVALQGVRQVVSETWWGVTGLPADVPSPRPRGPPYSGCRVVPGHSAGDLRPRPPPSGAQTSECGRHHPVALERRDLGWPSVHPRGGIVSASRPPGRVPAVSVR